MPRGHRVGPTSGQRHLGRALPNATGRVTVLVHGLSETERCWADRESAPGLMSAIEQRSDATPIAVRYNSGRRISDNGAALADLLEDMCGSWPVEPEVVTLVGHSMGGLVVRAACLSATERGLRWVDAVDRIVTLGTPHLGAPAEASCASL